MTKKVIKRKIKIIPILLLIVIISLLCLLVKLVASFKVQNIYILNNKYLTDDYVIEQAGLTKYPSYFFSFSYSIKSKLEKNDYIKKASVKKSFFGVIDIDILENLVLFYKENDKKYVLEDGKEVDSIPYSFVPITVVNYIPDTIYNSFVTRFAKISEEVRSKISEIKYDPSEYDDARLMLYMTDHNYVYVTLTKLDSLNYYNEIYPTLEGKKGILYLDSGNHFVEVK